MKIRIRSLAFLFLLPLPALSQSDQIQIRLVEDPNDPHFGSILLTGIDTVITAKDIEWKAAFRVYYRAPESDGDLSMLGKYQVSGQSVFYIPSFPLVQGKVYHIRLSSPLPESGFEVSVPVLTTPETPKIEQIYPTSGQWPANQLKFYIAFSRPMRYGQAMEHIRLEDENGNPAEAPFLDLGQELWDPGQRRLTVWFDPGRIKSLLIPNLEKGPPLLPNRKYRLVISKDWQAADGRPLGEDITREFTTGPKDNDKPAPGDWSLDPPQAHTTAPLMINFGYAMDYAMLLDGIAVYDPGNRPAEGRIEIGPEERSWLFYPESPWQPGRYSLRFSPDLEDLAGNNLDRAFDAAPSKNQISPPAFYERTIEVK